MNEVPLYLPDAWSHPQARDKPLSRFATGGGRFNRLYLTQCIYQLVSESQLPHKIVDRTS